jgi:TM2 domain-containing membrane protein YozV
VTTQPQTESTTPGGIGYLALVLAWIVPGLGHFLLGQRIRGIVFAVAIHGLFALGMLIAGVRAINPPEQAIWTYTQFLTGWPMLVANRLEKQLYERLYTSRDTRESSIMDHEYLRGRPDIDSNDPENIRRRQEHAKAFIKDHPLFSNHPKIQDIGAVYCGIAGMLNLLVMFDVLLRITGSTREVPDKKRRKNPPAPQPAQPASTTTGGNP